MGIVPYALDCLDPATAQPAADFCGRDNGRFIASCPATCQAPCSDSAFAIRSQAILNACRRVRDMSPAQRADAAECGALVAAVGGGSLAQAPQMPPPIELRPARPEARQPRQPAATAISRLGQGAETCIAQVVKSEPIETRLKRIGNPRLKEDVAAFWAGRPDCAPSSEALVDTFQCIQGGANEISQGYADIRRQMALSPGQSREDFCRVAKPLTEGNAYTELEQVDERVAQFDAKVADLNECAKKFRAWSEQRSARSDAPPQRGTAQPANPGPPRSVDPMPLANLTNELSTQLQENLAKFAGVQAGFIEIRENIGAMKREITGAVARAVNICP